MKHSIAQPEFFNDPPAALPVSSSVTMSFLWSRTRKFKQIWEVVQAVCNWPGVTVAPDTDGVCVLANGLALGRLRWDALLELSFGLEARDRLLAEAMAHPDPEDPQSGRIVFDVRTSEDVERAVWLLRLAYLNPDLNPPCGMTPRRPQSDLE